jgi:hypothetical protein
LSLAKECTVTLDPLFPREGGKYVTHTNALWVHLQVKRHQRKRKLWWIFFREMRKWWQRYIVVLCRSISFGGFSSVSIMHNIYSYNSQDWVALLIIFLWNLNCTYIGGLVVGKMVLIHMKRSGACIGQNVMV